MNNTNNLSDILKCTAATSLKSYILAIISIFLHSCTNIVEYDVQISDRNPIIQLRNWHILGPVKSSDKVIHSNFLDHNHLGIVGIPDSIFSLDPFNFDIDIPQPLQVENAFLNDKHFSGDAIIDFNQIKRINKNDTLVRGSAIYYYCNLKSEKDTKVYLLIRSANGIRIWLNSENTYSSVESKGFEVAFSDFIPLHLKTGDNYLVIKKIILSSEALFEGILCNKDVMTEEYLKTTSELLLYPSIITNDTLSLDRNHQQILDTVFNLSIYDLKKDSVFSYHLDTKSTHVPIANLEDNCSYRAYFKIGDRVFSQPFYKGNPDEAFNRFSMEGNRKRVNSDILSIQTDAPIKRLKALLEHSSRKDDWWWQLKVSSLIYELDNLYQNYLNKDQLLLYSTGIQMKAYFSKLDNTLQYYLLITPDGLTSTEKIPLVVVVRPNIENHHHFLTAPQVSRYWGLANAKYLANKNHYAIIMPASRMYSNEELIPMAATETILAIEDVQQHCNVDVDRIYLHGNCTAGYRVLSLACQYPDKFAAIGLYSPVYTTSSNNEWIIGNSPKSNISKLKNTPILLHFDPFDIHTPHSERMNLLDDCKKNGVNMTVSSSGLSGIYYNVLLVGEEALSFFKGKMRTDSSQREPIKNSIPKKIIADLFSEPFVFVFDSSNTSEQYKNTVDSIKNEYENYLFSKIPLIASDNLNFQDITNKNIFFIGHEFKNKDIKKILSKLPLTIDKDYIQLGKKRHSINHCMFQTIFENPFNKNKSIVIYSSSAMDYFSHIIRYPWKDSLEDCIVQRDY